MFNFIFSSTWPDDSSLTHTHARTQATSGEWVCVIFVGVQKE